MPTGIPRPPRSCPPPTLFLSFCWTAALRLPALLAVCPRRKRTGVNVCGALGGGIGCLPRPNYLYRRSLVPAGRSLNAVGQKKGRLCNTAPILRLMVEPIP